MTVVICEFCGEKVRKFKSPDRYKIILGVCDDCYCKQFPQKYLEKQIQEAGERHSKSK